MQTLIKWPGGKTREFQYLKDLIPEHDRYIEPFFGGGAVFFNIKPKKAIINDACEELMYFYEFVKGARDKDGFKKELYEYVDNWEKIPKFVDLFKNKFIKLYDRYKKADISESELRELVAKEILKYQNQFNGLFSNKFCLNEKNLEKQIVLNLFSKIKRTAKIERERGELPEGDLYKNIETAFRSGFYMHFRDVMNWDDKKHKMSLAKKIANYYFVREFCYGSMFRFNADGEFNIPYGGIAYNSKDFRGKVDRIFDDEVERLFSKANIKTGDFSQIFRKFKLSKRDFIFLDPPYDTNFSDYEKKAFEKTDQERLAEHLYTTKANFVLIIKNTPFIFSLYEGKRGIKIDKFEKQYLYNMKGRNNRDVEHLLIYNF